MCISKCEAARCARPERQATCCSACGRSPARPALPKHAAKAKCVWALPLLMLSHSHAKVLNNDMLTPSAAPSASADP